MKKPEKNLVCLTLFAGFLAMIFFASGSAMANNLDDEDCRSKACREALLAAKKATARYHNVDKALEDGFVQVSPCVSHPVLGTMGYHFANFGRVFNPAVSPEEPEVLLYLPDESGHLRLVAVEYVVPFGLATEPPVLFGQTFFTDGPPLNQYSLHVWAWRNNPSGIFAPFNPKLSCPSE